MKHLTKSHRQKISKALMGNKNPLRHKLSEKSRLKISQKRKQKMEKYGYLNSPETRKKMSEAKNGFIPWNKGMPMRETTKKRLSASLRKIWANPENHPNWKGGKSFEPYPSKFNNYLKRLIKKRDKYICQLCGVKEKDYFQKLSIHHIDFDKTNCEENNLITLCRGCNAKANFQGDKYSQLFKEKVQRL